MVAFYMVLFLIRPWEEMYPWMAVFPIERTFAILAIATVVLGGQFWFQFTGQTTTLLAFLGAVSLSAMLGIEPAKSWDQLYIYATVVIWYFLFNSVIRTPRALLAMETWWLFVWGLYMLKALWEFYCGRHDWHQGVSRMLGIETTYGNVNEFCACVTWTLPALVFVVRSRAEYPPSCSQVAQLGASSLLAHGLDVRRLDEQPQRDGENHPLLFSGQRQRWWTVQEDRATGGCPRRPPRHWIVMPEKSQDRFRTLWDASAGPESANGSAEARFEQDGFKVGWKALTMFPGTGVGIGNFPTYRAKYHDGQRFESHNLGGQVMGETGILGTITFVSLVAMILANCRRVRAAARVDPDPRLKMMSDCCISCRDTILLLLLAGLAGHVMLFYHWIWMAAFSQCAVRCVESIRREGSGSPVLYGLAHPEDLMACRLGAVWLLEIRRGDSPEFGLLDRWVDVI